MSGKILLVGSGGREHAIAKCLASSSQVESLIVAPGNAGTYRLPKTRNVTLNIKDHKEVIKFCKTQEITLVVIGPEDPLADGLADSLCEAKFKVFGPRKDAARIETSKAWTKMFMKRHKIPTAQFEVFETLDKAQDFINRCAWDGIVVKASGLAGGKGVVVAENKISAKIAIEDFKNHASAKMVEASQKIVLEEKLTGFEISVLALSDGKSVKTFPPAQDHKPRFAGGIGKNTGGMGAYCPCPLVSKDDLDFIEKNIIQKTVDSLREEGYPYIGTLYAGLMVTKDGPQVLEFNCRFGDPETQSIMPLLRSDLYSLMLACTEGKLDKCPLQMKDGLSCTSIAIVIDNYPGDVQQGLNLEIEGIENIHSSSSLEIYFAGTKLNENGRYLTCGGRVLNICAVDSNLKGARDKALEGAEKISFKNAPKGYGADFRKDIAFESVKREYENWGRNMTYAKSGVNVEEGNKLISNIKQLCDQTSRPGVKGELGMFGSIFDTKLARYINPLLVSGTDGVGTKLKIAIEAGVNHTVGEDLVAMCVNDILVHGAESLFFLDYFATSKLDKNIHEDVIKGIANGCLLANCSLVGGETAEMPGMYSSGDYDIAGFVVGAVEEEELLPKLDAMKSGNVIIGVASSGLHSNGLSLIRKVIESLNLDITKPALFNTEKKFYEELLKPTLIYTPLLGVLRSGLVLGAAHITGGGIEENLLRVIPKNLRVKIDVKWRIPSVYAWLSALGVSSSALHHTFNLGIGFMLIVKKENVRKVLGGIDNSFSSRILKERFATYPKPRLPDESENASAWVIGSLENKNDGERYELVGLEEALLRSGAILVDNLPRCVPSNQRRRVAVLISGTGTNLQALLDHTINWPSKAEIVLVISNVAGVLGLERAKKANVPTMTISHKNYGSREEFESEINKALVSYSVELICLAGFMRILTGSFVRTWSNKIINIHPSLLPSFKGKDAQKQALEADVCVTGCTVHFVTEEVDAGKIITQEPVFVKQGDTVETLSERIRAAEHKAFPRALEMVAGGRI